MKADPWQMHNRAYSNQTQDQDIAHFMKVQALTLVLAQTPPVLTLVIILTLASNDVAKAFETAELLRYKLPCRLRSEFIWICINC